MTERTYRSKQQTLRARDLRERSPKTEKRLWLHLRNAQAGAPFRRQHPVGPYFPDYYCVSLKLAVEIDGPLHDSENDASRDAWMKDRGITVLRFSVQEMDRNLTGVVDTIRNEIWLLKNRNAISQQS